MASHAGHNHPATPAARATCRKLGLDGKIRIEANGATGTKAPVTKIIAIPSSECDLHVPHCEMCGTANPEDEDGYTTCCNEPVVYGPCGHDHS
jgi:hypothetical protein